MTDDPATTRWARSAIGALVGATAWASAGTLAALHPTTGARVATLPGITWLAAAVVGGAVVAAAAAGAGSTVRRRSLAPLALLALLWLPWLPVRVPAAFLMWEGPLEPLIWVLAIGGLLWRTVPWPGMGRLAVWAAPPRAPYLAGLAAALVLTAAFVWVRPTVPAGDEPHYLVITQSLLRDADIRIENNHRQEHYLDYYASALKPDFMQRGLDGEIYSIHTPGISVLVLPGFALAGYPGAVATVIAVTAAGLSAAWLAAFWLTGSVAAAWAAWGALVASAPIVLHGYTVYPDPVGAAAAMAGVLALVALDRTERVPLAPTAWAGVGAVLATLPWLHVRFALLAGVIGAAILARLVGRPGARRAVVAFLVPPAVAAAGWFTYFWRIYGTPSPAAPYGARPEGGLEFIPAGVVGLLSDQQFGLAANAPVLLAGLVGLVPLARRRPRLAAELAAVLGPYLCVVAVYPMWWGGYSAPARFAVAVLPLLVLPLAAWWVQGPVGRGIIGVLTAVSATITLTLVGHDRGSFIYNGRDGHSLLYDWLSPTVDLTLGLPSVHRDGATTAAADLAIWVVAALVVTGVWVLLSRWRPRGTVTAVAGVVAAPLAAILAVLVVWAGRDRPAVTPPASQMAFLDRWQPERRPLGMALTPTRPLALTDVMQRLALSTNLRGHRTPGIRPLLTIPGLPAGEFDLVVEGRSRLAGTITVQLGRDDLTMEVWPLDGRPAGDTGLVLRLPAVAHSITITGDDAARESIRRLALRPRSLSDGPEARPTVLRASRLGDLVLFALDDEAFLESGAAWVRGEQRARFIVQPDAGATPVVRLKGGPIANSVSLDSGDWKVVLSLAPEEARDVTLPPAALAPATLSVTSATGFRPSEHGAGVLDTRRLGVYLTRP